MIAKPFSNNFLIFFVCYIYFPLFLETESHHEVLTGLEHPMKTRLASNT